MYPMLLPAGPLAPVAGEGVSQLPRDVVSADAVQFIVPSPGLSTPRLCEAGALPPATAVNVSPVCPSTIVCVLPLMVSETGTRTRWLSFVAAMATRPEYVPGASPAGFAVIATITGAFAVTAPFASDACSQVLPLVVVAVTLKSIEPEPLLRTRNE